VGDSTPSEDAAADLAGFETLTLTGTEQATRLIGRNERRNKAAIRLSGASTGAQASTSGTAASLGNNSIGPVPANVSVNGLAVNNPDTVQHTFTLLDNATQAPIAAPLVLAAGTTGTIPIPSGYKFGTTILVGNTPAMSTTPPNVTVLYVPNINSGHVWLGRREQVMNNNGMWMGPGDGISYEGQPEVWVKPVGDGSVSIIVADEWYSRTS
jgi:hypothetical protein